MDHDRRHVTDISRQCDPTDLARLGISGDYAGSLARLPFARVLDHLFEASQIQG
jgi:hypothetical protein